MTHIEIPAEFAVICEQNFEEPHDFSMDIVSVHPDYDEAEQRAAQLNEKQGFERDVTGSELFEYQIFRVVGVRKVGRLATLSLVEVVTDEYEEVEHPSVRYSITQTIETPQRRLAGVVVPDYPADPNNPFIDSSTGRLHPMWDLDLDDMLPEGEF